MCSIQLFYQLLVLTHLVAIPRQVSFVRLIYCVIHSTTQPSTNLVAIPRQVSFNLLICCAIYSTHLIAIPRQVSFGIVPPHVPDDVGVPHLEELFFLMCHVLELVY